MKRNFSIVFAAVMMVAMIFVSCSAQGVSEPKDTDTISIHLGQIVAKAADDGTVVYDRTAFDDKTQSTDSWTATVSAVDPSALFLTEFSGVSDFSDDEDLLLAA